MSIDIFRIGRDSSLRSERQIRGICHNTAYCLLPIANSLLPIAMSHDEHWMRRALDEARAAERSGEVPVGAVVVRGGELIGAGQNRNLRDNDPSAHAEIVALRSAGLALGNHRLEHCEIYVTIEPCAMCAGAMVHARLKRLTYGAKDPKAGAVDSVMQVLNHPELNHSMEVTGGVLDEECSSMLSQFFQEKRQNRPR